MAQLLSFVIPSKNEESSLDTLATKIFGIVNSVCHGYKAELVLVDDGSTDGSWKIIKNIALRYPGSVKAIRFRRNMGKALALQIGFQNSGGCIVFTMDGDLQDDPKEIPRFIDKLNEGYDLVSGWKKNRNDPLSKTLPSKLFNGVTARLTGVQLRDFNCGYKAYRKEVVDNLRLYGELHRYIPVLVADLGYRIAEIDVEHHARTQGRSKYGWERYLRGLIDLLTVLATTKWLVKPGHLFGGLGVVLGIMGCGILGYLALVWVFGNTAIGSRPLLAFGVLTTFASLQMISLGIIAELHLKSYPIDIDKFVLEKVVAEMKEVGSPIDRS